MRTVTVRLRYYPLNFTALLHCRWRQERIFTSEERVLNSQEYQDMARRDFLPGEHIRQPLLPISPFSPTDCVNYIINGN